MRQYAAFFAVIVECHHFLHISFHPLAGQSVPVGEACLWLAPSGQVGPMVVIEVLQNGIIFITFDSASIASPYNNQFDIKLLKQA
mgnify:CR=1 FL=1